MSYRSFNTAEENFHLAAGAPRPGRGAAQGTAGGAPVMAKVAAKRWLQQQPTPSKDMQDGASSFGKLVASDPKNFYGWLNTYDRDWRGVGREEPKEEA